MTQGLSHIYKAYLKECKKEGKEPMPEKQFKLCCEYGNMELVNSVIFEAKEVGLPYGMGALCVVRVRRNFEKAVVNQHETRKLKASGINAIVYFTDNHYFQFRWLKYKCHIRYKTLWAFKATRGNKNSVGGVTYILSQTLQTRPDLKARYKDKTYL